ncbi:branched-chain amino acid ABC transporter permease [Rhodococcus sp. H36-A4]|uniref:branched-chain amino acid ABC transporter permease n=1 Tax=Rhodococcus sp. H36-A4 TaxID=3004353 RepID=UPI0022AFC210|nr:branched-chain amino acid ABC transporter permease [Rhodococcus sp. H36-A4]MCZ4078042.1 branched-chain amino acid ABC transporter permease [Rhodococcus sp. H36-A4]
MSTFYYSHIVLFQSTFTVLFLALSIQVQLRMGVFSFAGAGFYGLGSYGAAIFVIRYGFSSFAAIAAIMIVCGAIGFLLALLVQRLNGLYLAMATVSFDLIITVIAHNGGSLTGASVGLYGALAFPQLTIGHIIAISVLVIALLALTERGRLGRRIDAVREDPELASSMGVNVSRYRIASFVVSGFIGALGGAINVLLRTTVAPESIGFPLVVLGLTIIIVGGGRSWLGIVIGAVIFTWLPYYLEIVGQYQAIVYGFIVAVAAVYVPGGIYGTVLDLIRKSKSKKAAVQREEEDSIHTEKVDSTSAPGEKP